MDWILRMIDQKEKLKRCLPWLASAPWVALDTEADSLHAYPEKLCLLQLAVGDDVALVDPLSGLDLAPLFEVLREKTLILHGGDFDLRLLRRNCEFVPKAVFDTMWAARLLGRKEFGLTDLVQADLGVRLEKGPQKMDWGRRPLTARMEEYARNDTRYLQPLAEQLREQLHGLGRLAWHEEVCRQMIQECSQPRFHDPETVWRVRGSDRLNRHGLAILKALWHWREDQAVARNKPPFFILSHEALVDLAESAASGLSIGQSLPRRLSAHKRAQLRAILEKVSATPPAHYPAKLRSSGRPMNAAEQARFDALKEIRDQHAARLALDPTLIASRARLVSLAKHGLESGNGLLSWQHQLLASSPCKSTTAC